MPYVPDIIPDINDGVQMTTAQKWYISVEAIVGVLLIVLLTLLICKQCRKPSESNIEAQYLEGQTERLNS